MLDVRRLRADLDEVKAGIARRGDDTEPLDRAAALDERHRRLSAERDDVRSRVNALSKEVGELKRAGSDDEADRRREESRALGELERALAGQAQESADEIRQVLLEVSNLPADDCPDGAGPDDNVVLRTVGDPAAYDDHQRVPHWEIGEALGVLDLERAARMSGAMFALYRGMGARLLRALVQLSLDRNAAAGWEAIRPPTLVRTETMVATGHLPKFADEAYEVERDDLWAIPTAEVPLASLARDEILDEPDLPVRLTAHTSCYRREAGAAGRETRGLLRVHEFDKVEMFAYVAPDAWRPTFDEMVAAAEALLVDLGLTYRILDLCTGDLGNAAARTWDLEAFAPGSDRWLEVSSVSWCTDYQARRANVRYRPAEGKGTEMAHTLNGSALGWARVVAALLETHRRPDGSVALPDVLHPYLSGATEILAPG